MLYVFIYWCWCPTRFPYYMTFVLFNSNTTGVTCGAETTNSSRAFDFTPVFSGIRTVRSLVFCVMFCVSLFVLLSFTLTTVCPFARLCIDHCLSFCPSLHWPLSVLLRCTTSDYAFGFVNLSLAHHRIMINIDIIELPSNLPTNQKIFFCQTSRTL
jgi:hypothetical protein